MNQLLHIHHDHLFTWLSFSQSGEILSQQTFHSLNEIPSANPKDRWLILIPGQSVLLTSVHLPKTHRRELEKAVPYALEEQLTNEIDQCHFAIGEPDREGNCLVGVIDKKTLEYYLSLLSSYHITPAVLLPDFLALSYQENTWSITLNDDTAAVRTEKMLGFSSLTTNLKLLLPLALEKTRLMPEKIKIHANTTLSIKNIFEKLPIPLESLTERSAYDYRETIKNPIFNLLSSHYRQKKSAVSHQRNPWPWVGVAAAIWLIVLMGTKFTYLFVSKHQIKQLQTQINTHYQQIFPGTLSDNPRLHLEQELNALQKSSQNDQFIQLLSRSGFILRHYSTITLNKITYQKNELILELSSEHLNDLEKFMRELHEIGLHIKQNQINTANKMITVELNIQ